jgi:hypothetical protein
VAATKAYLAGTDANAAQNGVVTRKRRALGDVSNQQPINDNTVSPSYLFSAANDCHTSSWACGNRLVAIHPYPRGLDGRHWHCLNLNSDALFAIPTDGA